MDRREFLRKGAAAVGSLPVWNAIAQGEATLRAAEVVAGKDPRLKVVETKPIVLETPLELLAQQRVTPKEILFVRNNVDLAGANRVARHDGAFELAIREWQAGASDGDCVPGGEKRISVEALRALPQTAVEMVLQCSGNSRSLMSAHAPIKGTAWDRGGVGNVVFGGVKLSSVFEKLGVRVASAARFLTALEQSL